MDHQSVRAFAAPIGRYGNWSRSNQGRDRIFRRQGKVGRENHIWSAERLDRVFERSVEIAPLIGDGAFAKFLKKLRVRCHQTPLKAINKSECSVQEKAAKCFSRLAVQRVGKTALASVQLLHRDEYVHQRNRSISAGRIKSLALRAGAEE